MKKGNRSYNIHYYLRLNDKWYCEVCRKFIGTYECTKKGHDISTHARAKNVKQVKRMISRLEKTEKGDVTVLKFIKYVKNRGHLSRELAYKLTEV